MSESDPVWIEKFKKKHGPRKLLGCPRKLVNG